MDINLRKYFQNTPFYIETHLVSNGPGVWDSTKVQIYRATTEPHRYNLIGEYLRNYSSSATKTFAPFQIGTDWYALYSTHYTATRVMRLHEDRIEDWCGEDPDPKGFCPAEVYVPQVLEMSQIVMEEASEYYLVDCDYSEEEFRDSRQHPDFVRSFYTDFAFVSGCVWGDDTSWKLRFIDLSGVPEKKLNITEKFGYLELPTNLSLKQCINMDSWEPDHKWVRVTRAEFHNLEFGDKD